MWENLEFSKTKIREIGSLDNSMQIFSKIFLGAHLHLMKIVSDAPTACRSSKINTPHYPWDLLFYVLQVKTLQYIPKTYQIISKPKLISRSWQPQILNELTNRFMLFYKNTWLWFQPVSSLHLKWFFTNLSCPTILFSKICLKGFSVKGLYVGELESCLYFK